MSKSLEQRIINILANGNAGSEAIAELIHETETAAATADQAAIDERTNSLDLAHDPHQARDRIAAAEMTRDQLKTSLPKLRERLSTALQSEAHERWLADFSRVRRQLDEAVTLFKDYEQHAEAIQNLFAMAGEVDKEISRVNGNAPDGEHRRLRAVELEARDLEGFTRDQPSLAATVELRDWKNSGKKLWPRTSSGSFAAEFAGMAVPQHPGAAWSDPEARAQRRTEQEKQHHEISTFFQAQTEQQEERLNREERERFLAQK
jgi:hypothetical protein